MMGEGLANMEEISTSIDMTEAKVAGHWNSSPAWKLPGWAEPMMVAMILCFACFLTRRRSASLFPSPQKEFYQSLRSNSPSVSDDCDSGDSTPYGSRVPTPLPLPSVTRHTAYYPPTKRTLFYGLFSIHTPDITRFRDTLLSRVLQKFPFLIEMLYWIITYGLYQLSRVLSQKYFTTGIWKRAQSHGEYILWLEHSYSSPLFYFFPITELSVQRWFMRGTWGLTLLNRTYALIHIPGTVGFIAWYYYAARNHEKFAVVRRTLTLSNWIAFAVFSMWPCMPPRLLPERWGFVDTVRRDSAQSVWMGGKYVNSLAAMPSMHFAYAFIVGIVVVQWSGVLQNCTWTARRGGGIEQNRIWRWTRDDPWEINDANQEDALEEDSFMDDVVNVDDGMHVDEVIGERGRGIWKRIGIWIIALAGVAYPCLILTAIVATANHYWLDALAGIIVVYIAYLGNRIFLIFLPIEDLFFWCCRAEKPLATTGWRARAGW